MSVITICYNEKNIRKTCESIVNQSWQDFEWIVVDGGSTDGTLDVLNEYRNRIDVLISEPDNGIYNAMNKGIARARGEWLNFMNGGDAFCDKTVLEQVFGNDNGYGDADVLYGDMLCQGKVYKIPDNIDAFFFIDNCINHQSSFIRAALFREDGGYNEKYRVLSDVEKWIVWMKAGRVFRHLPVVVADFDTGGVSSSGSLLTKEEKAKINARYYTAEELAAKLAGKKICWTVKLFDFLVLLKIRKEPFQDTFRVNLFGFVPLLKIRKNTK